MIGLLSTKIPRVDIMKNCLIYGRMHVLIKFKSVSKDTLKAWIGVKLLKQENEIDNTTE